MYALWLVIVAYVEATVKSVSRNPTGDTDQLCSSVISIS